MIEIKFKHTDIGLVPEDWEVSTFGIEFKKLNAASYTWSETFKDGSCAYLHYGEIHTKYHDHLDVQHSDLPFISKNQAKRFNKLQNGDLIMLNASEDYDGVNDCVEIINCDKELIAGQHTIPLRPISDKLVKGFIGYIPSIPAVRMQLIENAVGTKVYGVTNEMLQTVLLPIPTRHEQRRIASVLMKVDALISNLDKLIQKKQAIKKGAMQELLTGRKRLPGFKGEWKEIRLGNVANVMRGSSPRPIETYLTKSVNGINWIKIGDVSPNAKYIDRTEEKIKTSGVCNSRVVQKGDLILSNSMSFGRPYILKLNGCIHDGWLVIQDYQETYDVDFLYYALGSENTMDQYIAAAAGSSVKNLNKEKVSDVTIDTPTDKNEQRAIAHVLSTMDSDISVLEEKRDKYRQIKQGMMRDLLTGRIRLVENVDKESKLYSIGMTKDPSFEEAIVAEPHPD